MRLSCLHQIKLSSSSPSRQLLLLLLSSSLQQCSSSLLLLYHRATEVVKDASQTIGNEVWPKKCGSAGLLGLGALVIALFDSSLGLAPVLAQSGLHGLELECRNSVADLKRLLIVEKSALSTIKVNKASASIICVAQMVARIRFGSRLSGHECS
eukprot:3131057-Amphidinium_carterae.1